MELTNHHVDWVAHLERGMEAYDIVPRRHPAECWHISHSSLDLQAPPDWRYTRRKEDVYIPLKPHLVPDNPPDALSYAFQLGARAMRDFSGQRVVRLHLSIGTPINQVEDTESGHPLWQLWLGFGIVTK